MILWIILGMIVVVGLYGFNIVRPIEEGLVERFGKYTRTVNQGLTWIIPFVDTIRKVNITERMVDVEPQMVITKDKLNAEVDAVVYYQIKDTKKSIYNIENHRRQLTSLARTTLRAVIGKMSLADANEKRDQVNAEVEKVLDKETKSYGVEVLRVEIQRIEPPRDVQGAMNEVVKAEQKKIAAKDTATALETEADGTKRAAIKEAEGLAEGKKLVADANAYKIKVEFEAAEKYFKEKAQKLKELEVTRDSLQKNSKIILTEKGINPQLLIGELPLKK